MSDTVHLVLTGRVLPGFSIEAVAPGLARLLRIPEHQAQGLLTGSETVVKRGLPHHETPRYLDALTRIGVSVRTEPVPAPSMTLAPMPRATPSPSGSDAAPPATLALMPAPTEAITCPACQLTQPKRTLCRQCGADMPRMRSAQQDIPPDMAETSSANPYGAPRSAVRDVASDADETDTPPALGWLPQGRVGRVRYMAYAVAAMLPLFTAAVIGGVLAGVGKSPAAMMVCIAVGGLICLWLSIRVMAMRLHDVNLSGKWLLLCLLPVPMLLTGSPIAAFVLMAVLGLASLLLPLLPGHARDNDYGVPAGPNTLWTVVGAVVWGVITLSSFFVDGGRWKAAYGDRPGPRAAERIAQRARDPGRELTPEQQAQLEEMIRQRVQEAQDTE